MRIFYAPENITMFSRLNDCGYIYRMSSSWKNCSNIFGKCIDLKKENLKKIKRLNQNLLYTRSCI